MGRDFTLDRSSETTLALCEHCAWRAIRLTASAAADDAASHVRAAHGGEAGKRVMDAQRMRRLRMTA